VLEMLLPEYTRQLLENYQNVFSQVASQLRWLHFDDSFRLVTRVGFLDDGWIRVRVDGGSALDINMVEILRELSWTFYNIAEIGRKTDNLDVPLSSFVGVPDQAPPGRGVVLLGFDGSYLRMVRVTSDGRLLATLG
jgi:hypothetical protein